MPAFTVYKLQIQIIAAIMSYALSAGVILLEDIADKVTGLNFFT